MTTKSRPTRELVAEMTRDKFTVREIARALDLSTQGVHYHLNRLGMKPARKER